MRLFSPARPSIRRPCPSWLAGIALLWVSPIYAQEVPGGEALGAYFLLLGVVVVIPFYVYWALTTQIIARKTNTRNGWLAWIPIGNLVLWANIARKPFWWGLLCMVPFAGMVFMVLLWMAIAEARKKPNWWGILSIVPVVSLIVPGNLAWSDEAVIDHINSQ